MSKEYFNAAHEQLIAEYMDAHPNADWTEAYENTADAAWKRMQENFADAIDASRHRQGK